MRVREGETERGRKVTGNGGVGVGAADPPGTPSLPAPALASVNPLIPLSDGEISSSQFHKANGRRVVLFRDISETMSEK